MRTVYRFQFKEGPPVQEIENSLLLSVLSVESRYGRARIQLDAAFKLRRNDRVCLIDSENAIGQEIAQIFTGYLQREFGEGAFIVERVQVPDEELKSPVKEGAGHGAEVN